MDVTRIYPMNKMAEEAEDTPEEAYIEGVSSLE